MTTAVILHLPEDWTAQQALGIYELLHELAYERKQPLDSCIIVSLCCGFHQFLW